MHPLHAYYTQWCHYYVDFMSLICRFYVTFMSLSNFIIFWYIIKYLQFMSYVTRFWNFRRHYTDLRWFSNENWIIFSPFSANILRFSRKSAFSKLKWYLLQQSQLCHICQGVWSPLTQAINKKLKLTELLQKYLEISRIIPIFATLIPGSLWFSSCRVCF